MCYFRDEKIEDNKNLEEIDKEFPVVKKVKNVFELLFETEGELLIYECCDHCFYQELTSADLRQLSAYFLKVAEYLEKTVKEK